MFKYRDYILNESKSNNLNVGDIVICAKDYKKYNCYSKVATIQSIEGEGNNVVYTLKMQKNNGHTYDNEWMALNLNSYCYVDEMKLSKGQANKLIILDDEAYKMWKKGNLLNLECTDVFHRILDDMGFEIKFPFVDTSYVDIEKNSNTGVTYLPIAKFKSEVEGKWGILPYTLKSRQTMRVSKILKKLNPFLNESQLESFVAKYKASYKNIVENATERITVVTGEKIRYWYLGTRYGKDHLGNQGPLGNSCMRYNRSQKRFDIYCENPDVCALVIYLSEKNELLARALIWKLDDGNVYMDRIYYISQEDKVQLETYANKMKMKSYDSGYNEKNDLKVTLKKDYGKPENNPYMDTFKWFDFKNNILMNYNATTKDQFGEIKRKNFYSYTDHD